VVTERWLTALELPVFVWDVEALRADAVLEAHWITDLRRAWPCPAGSFGDLQYTLSRDRTQLYVGTVGGPVQALFSVSGGQLAASPAEGPALRVAATGTGRIRITAVFGSDRADLERTIHALDRKHFFGLRAQRSQHADQIREYGASLETPDAACDAAFEWAKVRADGSVVGAPGVGRSVVEGYPGPGADVRPGGGWYTGAGGCRVGLGLLAAGDRDAARDVLKFLLFTLDPAGRPVGEYSTSGLAHFEDPAAAPLLLLLAVRLADWAADLPYLGRHWEAVQRAYRGCIESDNGGDGLAGTAAPEDAAAWVMALEGLEALAEELGYPVFAEEVRVRAGKARAEASRRGLVVSERADATMVFGEGAHRRLSRLAATLRLGVKGAFAGESATLVDAAGPASEFLRLVVEGLWGVTPAALDGAVRIAPSLPAEWPEMTLHRLRVGRTVLNARVRRRPERLEARIQRVFGPRLHVALTFPGAGKPSAISVDEVALGGAQAAFEAEGIHEVVFHYP
jgi:hypothetical protein